MLRPFRIALLACLAAAASVYAFSIQSQIDDIRFENGVPSEAQDNRCECEPGDEGTTQTLQIQLNDGTSKTLNWLCPYKDNPYSMSFWGRTARTGKILRSRAFVSQNPVAFMRNASVTGPLYERSPITGRQLLGIPDYDCPTRLTFEKCDTTGNFNFPNAVVREKNDDGTIIPWNNLVAAACMRPSASANLANFGSARQIGGGGSVTQETDSLTASDCLNTVTPDMLSALATTGSGLNSSLYDWAASYRRLEDQNVLINNNFTQADIEAQLFLNQSLAVIRTQQNQTSALDGAETHTRALLVADLNNLTSILVNALRDEQNATLEISRLAIASQNDFDRQFSTLANLTVSVSQGLKNANQLIANNRLYVFQNKQNNQRALMSFYTLFGRAFRGDDNIDLQTKQIHRARNNPEMMIAADGTPLTMFTEDVGTPPAEDFDDLGDLSTILKSYNVNRVATPDLYGVQSVFALSCGSVFDLNSALWQPTYADIQRQVGGPECVANYSKGVPGEYRCLCFRSVVETRCPLANSGTAAAWQAANYDDDGADDLCLSPPAAFAGGSNGTALRTIDEYATAVAALSQRGSLLGYYHPRSVMANVDALPGTVPYSSLLSDPTNSALIMESTDDTGLDSNTLLFWLNKADELSWNAADDNRQFYRDAIQGTPPNYMDQQEIFYQRFADGSVDSGTMWSVMLKSNDSVLMSVLTPGETQADLTAQLDGVTVAVTDVQVVDPHDDKLPVVDVLVYHPNTFATDMYNTAEEDVRLDPYPPARAHGLAYNAYATEGQDTRDQWQIINQTPYVHEHGTNVPSLHLQSVDNNPASITYGRCIDSDPAAAGDWCLRRRNFALSITTSTAFDDVTTPSTLNFRSRNAYVSGTVTTRRGHLSQNVIAQCPAVLTYAPSGTDVLVRLVNTNTTSGIVFRISQVGACVHEQEDVTMVSGGDETRTFERCAIAPAGTPDYVQFSYVSDATTTPPTFTVCPVIVPLAAGAGAAQGFVGAASVGGVLLLAVRGSNTVQAGLQRSIDRQIQALYVASLRGLSDEFELGFAVPQETIDAYQAIADDLAQIRAQSEADAAAAAAQSIDLSTELQSFDAQMQALNAESQIEFDALRSDFAALVATNANNQLNIDQAVEFAKTDQSKLGTMVSRVSPFFNALKAIVNGTIHTVFRGTDVGGDDLTNTADLIHALGGLEHSSVGLLEDLFVGPLNSLFNAFFNGNLKNWVTGVLPIVIVSMFLFFGGGYGAIYLYRYIQNLRSLTPADMEKVRAMQRKLGIVPKTTAGKPPLPANALRD